MLSTHYKFWEILIVIPLVALWSCASSPPSQSHIAKTEAAIQQAINVDARDRAPLNLRSAQQNMEKAEVAIKNENYEAANRYLDKAASDAELAIIKSRAESAKQAAEQIRASTKVLEEKLSQSGSS